MDENNTPAAAFEADQTADEKQPPVQECPTVEQPKVDSLIADLRIEYERKIDKITNDFTAKLSERDNVIKQLLTEDSTDEVPSSIADIINAKRNYKKW